MSVVSRREFLCSSVALGAVAASPLCASGANAAMSPNDKFDLVIRGGEVIDPRVSVPIEKAHRPAAVAEAEPALDPLEPVIAYAAREIQGHRAVSVTTVDRMFVERILQ